MRAALNGSYFEYKIKKGNLTLRMTSWERSGFIWQVNPAPVKTSTKFFNVIGYHQPDFSINRTVYASSLYLESAIGQLKRQLTRHNYVSGQNALWARAVVLHFDELTNVFYLFIFYENVQPMSSSDSTRSYYHHKLHT